MLIPQYMVRRRRRQGSLAGCAVLATITLVTAIFAVLPSTASANSSGYQSEYVRHHDLNLAHKEDVTKLHRRVNRAAKNLCSLPGIASEILKREINTCVDETTANALQSIEQKVSVLAAEMR